jgi:uncharacterized membrane protein YgcG
MFSSLVLLTLWVILPFALDVAAKLGFKTKEQQRWLFRRQYTFHFFWFLEGFGQSGSNSSDRSSSSGASGSSWSSSSSDSGSSFSGGGGSFGGGGSSGSW